MPLQACPVPIRWLVADARLGPDLLVAARTMPPRSAILVRACALPVADRAMLVLALRRIGRARRHMLIWSGGQPQSGYPARHGKARHRADRLLVMPVHGPREAAAAKRQRADAVLISPVHPTRSHPGGQILGKTGFQRLAAGCGRPAVALGGMNAHRFLRLRRHGAKGWAAIDAWQGAAGLVEAQKRNWVPTKTA